MSTIGLITPVNDSESSVAVESPQKVRKPIFNRR